VLSGRWRCKSGARSRDRLLHPRRAPRARSVARRDCARCPPPPLGANRLAERCPPGAVTPRSVLNSINTSLHRNAITSPSQRTLFVCLCPCRCGCCARRGAAGTTQPSSPALGIDLWTERHVSVKTNYTRNGRNGARGRTTVPHGPQAAEVLTQAVHGVLRRQAGG